MTGNEETNPMEMDGNEQMDDRDIDNRNYYQEIVDFLLTGNRKSSHQLSTSDNHGINIRAMNYCVRNIVSHQVISNMSIKINFR
jgi:hypothetical protein